MSNELFKLKTFSTPAPKPTYPAYNFYRLVDTRLADNVTWNHKNELHLKDAKGRYVTSQVICIACPIFNIDLTYRFFSLYTNTLVLGSFGFYGIISLLFIL